ncbi:MAG: choice-of-anchor D domain-containing protein [Flavobacteriaceae bacterium]|nr:choice-of-anchor D domain-containing protein [Flavobacteriaceae bacterium]
MKCFNQYKFTVLVLLFSAFSYGQGTLTVTGNGNTITSGDTTPWITDGTDFGTIIVGNNNPNTFVLDNTASGGSPGNRLNGITVTITGSADFTPAVANLGNLTGNGTPLNHIITFTPSTPGLKTATVTITFTNGTNSPYTFAIQGTGQAAVPEMDVTGLGISIADGDITPSTTDDTDFGTTAIGFPVAHTFTIHNLGTANLNLGATAVTGANPLDFVVTTPPATPVTPAGTTTFVITFNPTALGTRTATFSIVNDDADENPYNFDLTGVATTPQPEIDIQGNGNSIVDGDITPSTTDDTDFGNVDITAGTNVNTFTIYNTGTLTLNLMGASPYVTISGTHAADFTVTAIPSNTIGIGGSTTFDITFNPSALGLRTAVVTIGNDDADENPYNFDIQGTGIDLCGGYVNTFPYTEDFESGTGMWAQDTGDNFDWTQGTGGTPTASTGPSGAYNGSNYYYTESDGNNSSTANLISPCFVLTGTTNPRATFYAHIYGSHVNSFSVDLSTDSGLTYPNNLITITGQTQTANNSEWIPLSFDLSSYIGQTIKIRIQGNTGAGNRSDIAIDNFSIIDRSDPTIGPGGETSSLALWLKSNDGHTLTDGQSLSNWLDQGRGDDGKINTTGQEPTYRDNAAQNINFNPVIEFDNSYNTFTTDGDYSYDDNTREFLYGDYGFFTQEIFIVIIPDDTPITNSFGFMDVFCSDAHVETNQTDATGLGFGDYTGRINNEIISYAHDTFSGAGDGYAVAEIGTGSSYDNVSIINTRNNAANTLQELYLNANDIETTQNDTAEYMNTSDGRWWIGRSEGWEASLNARIAEVITFDSRLADADLTQARNRVQSYLAVKYGITLGANGTSQDYVDSNGTVIWDQSANAGFNYDIAGIGRDDDSELLQKQSSSVNNATDGTGPIEGVLTMGLTDIYTTNNENITTNSNTFNDGEYLMWGNNGASLNGAAMSVTVDMSAGIGDASLVTNVSFEAIPRIWKVVENGGDIGTVKVSLPSNAVRTATPPDGRYLMFISSTGVFDPTADYRVMDESGATLSTTYDFDGTEYITFGWAPERVFERSIYFDPANLDYIDMEDNLDVNPSEFTISAWINRGANSTDKSILSKRDAGFTEGYDLRINTLGRLHFRWRNSGGPIQEVTSSVVIPTDKWHHVAAIYDGTDVTLYIDGVADTTRTRIAPVATNQSFFVGAAGKTGTTAYFHGNIDEVRVWDAALTATQLRYVMNQEIEDNSSFVGGKYFQDLAITPTKDDTATLPWSDLAGYYPMSTYTYTNTKDESGNGIQGSLKNLVTVDWQTAPLPYKSTQTGTWENLNTWENGSVQNIPGTTSIVDSNVSVDWNIVQINHDVNIINATDLPAVNNDNRKVLGLFVNANTLTVDGNNATGEGYGLTVTHYLNLDGDIDLEGESQLIQTMNSDLEVTSSGRLERDQQGTADTYTYNYWSAPVGISNITSNNNNYTLPDILRDGTSNINWLTSGYNGSNASPIGIADYWIWKFANQPDDDYASWQHVRSTGTVNAGEGFTMKGPGSGAILDDQNYVYLGKPNNADINLTLSSGNDYLVGNPYPSALDANQFILDNGALINGAGATTGTLYFWEHWGGGSHVLSQYQGGYATYNLSGGTPSAAMGTNDPDVGTGGTPTKTPGRYIPVAQGFFVVAETAGTINFNNGQRVFHKESSGNSIFVEAPQSDNPTFGSEGSNGLGDFELFEEEESRPQFRIGFNSVNTMRRQLLFTVDDNATDGIDNGYDGQLNEDQIDDLYWLINNDKYVIQGTDNLSENTVLPLGIHTENDGLNTIVLDELLNAQEDMKVWIHDKDLELYHDLMESGYEFYLPAGENLSRFEIVFRYVETGTDNSDLTDDEEAIDEVILEDEETGSFNVYYSNDMDSIIIVNPFNINISSITIYNVIGQKIYSIENIPSENSYVEYKVSNLSTGTYILQSETEQGNITKKVLVE